MNLPELIERKREGGVLSEDELTSIIDGYATGEIPDYQVSALLMAIFFRGMTDAELSAWTDAMLNSGERIDMSGAGRPIVDKHSTGGVGDKISIPLAPVLAACGAGVPMMSGRGLGHTGGTLDKLESIPGFSTQLTIPQVVDQVTSIGVAMAGQSETLVPADRKLYALRDATATVASIPLISSSIMSKKLAEGLDALVLDVKTGAGAFMEQRDAAVTLAETMVGIGERYGVKMTALVTDMSEPLGRMVGNSLEIRESIDVLRGAGPPDVTELVVALGAEVLASVGLADGVDAARASVTGHIADGSALEVFRTLVEIQGGDVGVIDDPDRLPGAVSVHDVVAAQSGHVTGCDAKKIGVASVRLGGGRTKVGEAIDPGVGIEILKKRGDRVEAGEVLGRVHSNDPGRRADAQELIDDAWSIGTEPPPSTDIILEAIRP